MRSCDPWFYHIGLTYDQAGGKFQDAISNMARAFGLGKATGIGQVAEATGSIRYPTDGLDATSIAIGQGKVLVTPLQVAAYIAAVANGGTLYRPQLVEKVQPVSGNPISVFSPQSMLPCRSHRQICKSSRLPCARWLKIHAARRTTNWWDAHYHCRQDRHRREWLYQSGTPGLADIVWKTILTSRILPWSCLLD